MSSPAVRRFIVALGLVVVFGIGVSNIIRGPAQRAAQSPVARNAPANDTFTDQNATDPSAARDAAAADQTALMAQVRYSVANAAPGSTIVIKDTNGVVALAGSVPSQDVLEQARQAAQQVSGVKQVDTSAVVVANR